MASRGQSKRAGGPGSLGVVSQIDRRLSELDRELESMSELMAERRRLVQARQAITGERVSTGPDLVRRISSDQIADYLTQHPGSRAGSIAGALGVPLTNVSQHLHRGKDTRFERRADGWHVRKAKRR
jgi:hypothetical protein